MYTGTLIEDLLNTVDRLMPRTGDAFLDLATAKIILADRKPMSKEDVSLWRKADRLQEEVQDGPAHPTKLIRIETSRGRPLLVPCEDLEIQVTADGHILVQTSFGPCRERVLPFYQAIEINAGEFPEYEEEA